MTNAEKKEWEKEKQRRKQEFLPIETRKEAHKTQDSEDEKDNHDFAYKQQTA